MGATTERAAGSTQVQHLIWAMGEARIRRVDVDQDADGVVEARGPGADLTPGKPDGASPVADARPVPPDVECADFFTEWQPSGPS
ncbi:MAG: hypothetical protein ACRD2W_17410 [Acidimicrobiales bacterium]